MSGATSSSVPGPEESPFRSLDEFRAESERLLTTYQALPKPPGLSEIIEPVRVYVARGRLTGARLSSNEERWEVQSLLDYWVAVFYREGLEPPETTLVNYQPELASGLTDEDCPYVGLTVFRPELQDRNYYGRKEFLYKLAETFNAGRGPLIVVGPSGGDKSLIVLGGLLPALRSGDLIPASRNWKYLPVVMPGRNPLVDLAGALTRSQGDCTPSGIRAQAHEFRRETSHLSEKLRLFGADDSPVVLIVDRLEELYRQGAPPADRKAFLQNLNSVVKICPNARIIITVDGPSFNKVVSECSLLQPAFVRPTNRRAGPTVAQSWRMLKLIKQAESRDLARSKEVQLPPMSQAEIYRTVMKPAERVGLEYEDELVSRLIDDVYGDPSCLALLEALLLELWDLRRGNLITWDAYNTLKGPRQAFVVRAERFYDQLALPERPLIEALVRRLVAFQSSGETVLRRERSDAIRDALGAATLDLLRKLQRDRLVTAYDEAGEVLDPDQVSGEIKAVELRHVALARDWGRAVEWLDQQRDEGWGEVEGAYRAELEARARRKLRNVAACLGFLAFGILGIGWAMTRTALRNAERANRRVEELTGRLGLMETEAYVFGKYHGRQVLEPDDVHQAVRILDGGDTAARTLAATMLGSSRATEAVPGLLAALSSRDEDLCKAAAIALGRIRPASIGVAAALAKLIEDHRAVTEAASALGKIGTSAVVAVPVLATVLSGKDSTAPSRKAAAESLGEIGVPSTECINALADALTNDRDAEVRRAAAVALGDVGAGKAEAANALVAALRSTDELIRKSAGQALERMAPRTDELRTALAAGMNPSEPMEVRKQSFDILQRLMGNDPSVVSILLSGLKDQSQEIRDNAIVALGNLAVIDQSTVRSLAQLLADKTTNPQVRYAVAKTLDRFGEKAASARDALVSALRDDEVPGVRYAAAEALGQIGSKDESLIRALTTSLLSEQDPSVQQVIINILALIGQEYKGTAPTLTTLLRYNLNSQAIYLDAVRLLYRMSQTRREAAEGMAGALVSDNSAVRTAALGVINPGSPEAKAILPFLLPFLKDKKNDIRVYAVSSLARFSAEDPQVLSALLAALGDSDSQVSRVAFNTLVTKGEDSDNFVKDLINTLKTLSSQPRGLLIAALAKIGENSASARAQIRRATADGDVLVREGAAEVLGKLRVDIPANAAALSRALKDVSDAVQTVAARSLGKLGWDLSHPNIIISDLVTALSDKSKSENVRQTVVIALGDIGRSDPAVVDALAAALSDESNRIRTVSASILRRLSQQKEGERAVESLANVVKDGSPESRRLAAATLGQIGSKAKPAVPALAAAISNVNNSVRLSAINALGEIGPEAKDAVPTLSSALSNADASTRSAIESALRKIDANR